MLQAIRDKTSGLIAGIIFTLLILTMAVYALPGFFGGSLSSAVAEVNGENITQTEWQDYFNRVRQNMQQRAGPNFNPAMIENPLFKRQSLDQLIDDLLLRQDAEGSGANVSMARLQKQIAGIETFHLDGKFNEAMYLDTLARARMTEDQLFADLKDAALSSEIRSALRQSMFVSDAEVDAYVRLRDQQRSFRFVRLASADVPAAAEPGAEEIKKYFDAHPGDFMTDEQLDLEYVDIKLSDIPAIAPNEADVLAQYEKTKASFLQTEQRLASHILFELAADAPAEAQKAALAKAEEVLKEARAEGAKFDELARKHSNDVGSAEQGGDLGWLPKGATEAAFDTALFAMKAGEISEPIKTEQGYHLIQLREVQAERTKTFEEAKAELTAQLTEDRRLTVFNDQISALSNALQTDPFQLSGPAEKLGLKVQRSGMFPRSAPTGIAANPALASDLADEKIIERGQVSPVVKIDESQRVAFRVVERKKPEPKKLEEVSEQIKQLLVREAQEKALKEKANEWLVKLKSEGKLDTFIDESKKTAETADGVVRTAMNFPAQVLTEVFKLKRPAAEQKVIALAEISPQEYALVELSAVTEGDPTKLDAAARDAVREQLRNEWSYAEAQAYLQSLRSAATITIHEDRL